MFSTPDNRSTPRHRTLKGARIVFNGGRSTVDCTVRNLYDTGAKLEVTSVVEIPATFDLALGQDLRPCRVAWRTTLRAC